MTQEQELKRLILEIRAVKDEKKEANADWNSRIKILTKKVEQLAAEVK